MVWTKLNDRYGDDCAPLSDAAFRTHTEALNWTMRRETEGRITTRDLRRFAETADPDAAVAYLVEIGWWVGHESGDGWQVIKDMDYQRTKEQIGADRAATADRQRRWRESHGKRKPRPKPDKPVRDDVERICTHLADRIEGNGSKRPAITQAWRDEARLMLDRDGRQEAQVARAIDWCQADDFWRRNVMSMAALRKQYDRMRMQAEDERNQQRNGHSGAMRGGARTELLTAEEAAELDPRSVV